MWRSRSTGARTGGDRRAGEDRPAAVVHRRAAGAGCPPGRLGSLIFGCEGVKNYELTAPPEDLALEPDQLPVLGTLTVEAMQ